MPELTIQLSLRELELVHAGVKMIRIFVEQAESVEQYFGLAQGDLPILDSLGLRLHSKLATARTEAKP